MIWKRAFSLGLLAAAVAVNGAPSDVLAARQSDLSTLVASTQDLLGAAAAVKENDGSAELVAETHARLEPLLGLVKTFHSDIELDLHKHEQEEQQLRGDDKADLDALYKSREEARTAIDDNIEHLETLNETKNAQTQRLSDHIEYAAKTSHDLVAHTSTCLAKEPERVLRLKRAQQDLTLVTQLMARLSIIQGDGSDMDSIDDLMSAPKINSTESKNTTHSSLTSLVQEDAHSLPSFEALQTALSNNRLSKSLKLGLQELIGTEASTSASVGYDLSRMVRMIKRFEGELSRTVGQETAELDQLRKHCDQAEYSLRREISQTHDKIDITNTSLSFLDQQIADVIQTRPSLDQVLAARSLSYDERFDATQRRVKVALTLRRGYQHVLEVSKEIITVVGRYEDAYAHSHIVLPDMD